MKSMASERTYVLAIDYLPNEYDEKAKTDLKETPANSRLLEQLKRMAQSKDETKEIDFHDDLLRQFLRQSKYDVEKSIKRLLAFTKFRRQNQSVFLNVEDISKSPDYQFCTPLPWRCREGCTITLFEFCKWEPRNITIEDLLRLGLLMYHQSLRNPLTQINGFKMIVDWKGSNLGQLKHTPPKYLFLAFKAFLVCTPARNREIHFVNQSAVCRAVWTFLQPFVSEKLKKRIIIHSSPEDLLNYFPKHALPVQYGGDLDNYYMEDWMKAANEQQKLATLAGQCNDF